jgi:TRAP-type C4-dicarboxylate transport system permease small subunit
MTTIYRWWSWLLVLAILVQVGFAGYGAFDVASNAEDGTVNEDSFEDSWGLHLGFGYLVVLIGLVLLVITLIARPGRRRVWHVVALAALLVLQVILAWIGESVPGLGFLHPINALVLFGLATWNAWVAWGGRVREEARVPSPAA